MSLRIAVFFSLIKVGCQVAVFLRSSYILYSSMSLSLNFNNGRTLNDAGKELLIASSSRI
jgi:hypothetical protein